MANLYPPGTLVRARRRDWVVQSGSTSDWLRLRPMGGAEDEVTELAPALEMDPVTLAQFPEPDPQRVGPFFSAELLYNALRFQLRNGAGPFRSFGSIAVEPRSYQLVPLLMAMRREVVRLLIADDVGIGKTIEAGLIVRELLDRGEINRFAVLCPPHLVEQWVAELESRFNLKAAALTGATAARLERLVPHGKSMSDVYPHLVVSLDYIKSERHRDYFHSMNFEMIVVDEAHTCTKLSGTPKTKQLRFDLLKMLSDDPGRHMILLTATPHSGNEEGFFNLLSLLNPKFAQLGSARGREREKLRQELAQHFIQRRRIDISEWKVAKDDRAVGFPTRMTAECPYELSRKAEAFLTAIRDFCRKMMDQADPDSGASRMLGYTVISMLRCTSSSPAAAVQMLRNRIGDAAEAVKLDALEMEDEFGDPEDDVVNDVEPAAPGSGHEEEWRLLKMALALEASPKDDAKLGEVLRRVKELVAEGFNPVVFCRYVATAHYVADALKAAFKSEKALLVECVTGEFVPEERRAKVDALGQAEKRVLVATDCLSEGINLQEQMNAVVHYDLAWNPTRHEQREGRIDRFGQRSHEVHALMLYGKNNPVDGFILDVIIKKSERIRKSLGVTVPVPLEHDFIGQALLEAALFRRKPAAAGDAQGALFAEEELKQSSALEKLELSWKNALENMRKTNTIFAQNAIKPDAVYPLWEAQREALGGHGDVEGFCREAAAGIGFRFEPMRNGLFRLPLESVKFESIAERLRDEGFGGDAVVDFEALHRSSPLVNALAEGIVNEALAGESRTVVRCAVTESVEVEKLTRVYLLRLRFQMRIAYRNQTRRFLMAEEILPVAAVGCRDVEWRISPEVRALIHLKARGNLSVDFCAKQIEGAEALLRGNAAKLQEIARRRAEALLADHNRVKDFTANGSVAEVSPCLPVDVMGVFVILPAED